MNALGDEQLEEQTMNRELGTDRRDVPHRFVDSDDRSRSDCSVCERSFNDERHVEWAKLQKTLRQQASEGSLPREHG